MTKARIFVVILFLGSLAAFIYYNYTEYMNRDLLGPEIYVAEKQIEVSINDDDDVILAGVTAFDERDGVVTPYLGIEELSPINSEGIREVGIVAFDDNGHVTRATREIKYTDYEHPKFYFDGPVRAQLSSGIVSALQLVHATDCLDGDITDQIRFEYDKPDEGFVVGDYPITAEVTNSAGDKETIRFTATMFQANLDNLSPRAVLSEYVTYVKKGKKLQPLDFVKYVIYQGKEYEVTEEKGTFRNNDTNGSSKASINKEWISITDNVDYDTPGCYEITYSIMDAQGNEGHINLVVIVEEDN